MASWDQIRREQEQRRTPQGTLDFDGLRREKYTRVEAVTGRPLVVLASDFLNRGKVAACGGDVSIDLADRDGIIEVTAQLPNDTADILVFSPGGLPDAAESIVHIIRSKFRHTRFLVPAIAKSAATMMALSGDELLMERNAELGPIDPQFHITRPDGTMIPAPAQAIIDQFEKAQDLIGKDPSKLPAWMPVLQQYGPALYQQSLNAIELSKDKVREWLSTGMFKGIADPKERDERAKQVAEYLGNHNQFKSHGARVGIKELRDRGVPVVDINDDASLQDAVMSVHHAIMLTFGGTGAYKIFENSRGQALIRLIQTAQIQLPIPLQMFQQPGGQPAPGQGPTRPPTLPASPA